jgi:endonuclease VIII
MPEGDTIHRAASTLQRALAGKTVTRFETGYAQLANVDRDTPIVGRTIESVSALGKHLLMRFSGGLTLRTHLRMNGSWHLYRTQERWQRAASRMRVLVEAGDLVAVGFDVPVAEWIPTDSLKRDRTLRTLGPDLLAEDFDLEEATSRFRAALGRPLAEALLDQRIAAGAGNVFKCEVLFDLGHYPFDDVARYSAEELRALLRRTCELMRVNVGPGSPSGRTTTGRDDPHAKLWVYGRGAEPCRRCATAIAYVKRGDDARGTYYCPRCQPPRGVPR